MIIKNLELENFKSYLNEYFDFNTGISIIMGDNGAGKSTILESISFALFKEYSGKKVDQLINNERNDMKVTAEFIANGRTYKVIRKRKRNSTPESTLYVEDNGRFSLIEKGDAAVSNEIEKIIDLDKNLFLNAVYVRQGEIADLITKNPAEKKEMIGRLLGVDDLENSWKNMKFVIDDYNKQQIRLNGKLENFGDTEEALKKKEADKKELNDLLEIKKSELKEKKDNLAKFEKIKEFFDNKEIEFINLSQKIEHENEILQGLDESENELNNQIKEIKNKESQIEEMIPYVNKIPTLEELNESIQKLNILEGEKTHKYNSIKKIELFKGIIVNNEEAHDKFIALEDQINELTELRKKYEGSDSINENLQNNMKNLQEEKDRLEENISSKLDSYGKILENEVSSIDQLEAYFKEKKINIKTELDLINEQIERFNFEISDLKGQNKEIKKSSDELENAEDICPVCESDLDDYRKNELQEKYGNLINENIDQISSYNERLGELKSKKGFLENKQSKTDSVNIDVLKKESEDLTGIDKRIEEINLNLVELEKSVKCLNDINTKLNEKKDLMIKLKEGHQKYLGALNSLNALDDLEELQKDLNDLNDKIEPLKIKISSLCVDVDVNKEDVSNELQKFRNIKGKYDVLCGEVKVKDDVLKNLSHVEMDKKTHSRLLEERKQHLKEIGYEHEKHDLANKNLKRCQDEFERLQNNMGIINGQLNGIFQRIDELKNEIEEYNKDKKELEKTGRFVELLNDIRSLYGKDGLQKDLRNKSKPIIENNTLEFFNKFNFEYSDLKLDENYDLTLFGPSGENTLDMISGGEIIAIAIALRLGIAKTLVKGNLELMILDEPTVHLDSYRRHELIDIIKKLSIIPQMIIVTHDAGLEEAADNILKIEKENGVSSISDI